MGFLAIAATELLPTLPVVHWTTRYVGNELPAQRYWWGGERLMLAERVPRSLTDAGFGVDDAGRILTLVSGIALSAAHDVLGAADSRRHHQNPEVARVLKEPPAEDFPLLSAVNARRAAAAGDDHDFEFNLGVIIAGLEHALGN